MFVCALYVAWFAWLYMGPTHFMRLEGATCKYRKCNEDVTHAKTVRLAADGPFFVVIVCPVQMDLVSHRHAALCQPICKLGIPVGQYS